MKCLSAAAAYGAVSLRLACATDRFVLQASRKLHERMAYAIFRSPMSFFEVGGSLRFQN